MTTNEQGKTQSASRQTLPLAALLALLGTATAANAGQILLVNAIDSVHGGIATYSYAPDSNGNFVASSRTLLTSSLRNSNWLVQGPAGATVPYLWETDAYAGINRYSTTGVSQQYAQPVSDCDQCQSVEDSFGNAYVKQVNTSKIAKIAPDGSGGLITSTGSNGLTIGPDGYLYTQPFSTGVIEKYTTGGADAGQFAAYSGVGVSQLAFDSHGNLFGLSGNNLVEWNSTGSYLGVFKSGLPGTLGGGRSQDPNSFAIDGNDNIWLAQGYGSLYKITANGTLTNFDLSNSGLQAFSVAVLDTGAATPEPSTGLLLLGAGCLCALGRRRFATVAN